MLKDVVRKEFDIIMAWSVDRFGRSLQHLVVFLDEIHAKRVHLYLHQQGVDITTPSGKGLFQMSGVFALIGPNYIFMCRKGVPKHPLISQGLRITSRGPGRQSHRMADRPAFG